MLAQVIPVSSYTVYMVNLRDFSEQRIFLVGNRMTPVI